MFFPVICRNAQPTLFLPRHLRIMPVWLHLAASSIPSILHSPFGFVTSLCLSFLASSMPSGRIHSLACHWTDSWKQDSSTVNAGICRHVDPIIGRCFLSHFDHCINRIKVLVPVYLPNYHNKRLPCSTCWSLFPTYVHLYTEYFNLESVLSSLPAVSLPLGMIGSLYSSIYSPASSISIKVFFHFMLSIFDRSDNNHVFAVSHDDWGWISSGLAEVTGLLKRKRKKKISGEA